MESLNYSTHYYYDYINFLSFSSLSPSHSLCLIHISGCICPIVQSHFFHYIFFLYSYIYIGMPNSVYVNYRLNYLLQLLFFHVYSTSYVASCCCCCSLCIYTCRLILLFFPSKLLMKND